MAAEKVVSGQTSGGQARQMKWEKPARDQYYFQAPIEIDAARVGGLFLFVNPNFERAWTFKLRLRDEDVCRWDLRPRPSGHNNPPGCPNAFPRKVREAEHEHVWVDGLQLNCARPLGLATSDHRATFDEFCQRTHVRFDPEYVAPQAFEQLEL